jgi:hypothetical protein
MEQDSLLRREPLFEWNVLAVVLIALSEKPHRTTATAQFTPYRVVRAEPLSVVISRDLMESPHEIGREGEQFAHISGVQKFRSSEVQEFRSSGVQKLRSSDICQEVQEFRH